eukprot:scaffold60854_cov18-Tisochrysis_lutea.AAC.1
MAIPGSAQGSAAGASACNDTDQNAHASRGAAPAPDPPRSNSNTTISSPSSSFFDYFNPSKWGTSPANASAPYAQSFPSSQHPQQQQHQPQHPNAQGLPPLKP